MVGEITREELHKYYGGEVVLSDFYNKLTMIKVSNQIYKADTFNHKCYENVVYRNNHKGEYIK